MMSTVEELHNALMDILDEIQETEAQLGEIPMADVSERERIEKLLVQLLDTSEELSKQYKEARLKHM